MSDHLPIVKSPAPLSRSDLRTVIAHLTELAEHTRSYAYLFARDGHGKLVEVRVAPNRRGKLVASVTPVDESGLGIGLTRPVRGGFRLPLPAPAARIMAAMVGLVPVVVLVESLLG